jgi:hypothetical protein
MTGADIPHAVRAWLYEHVRTYDELETLLLLHRQRDRDWSAAALAEALKIAPAVAAEALAEFARRGLAAPGAAPDAFRYRPATPELELLVDHLARAYADDRLTVIELMTANAIERMRTGAMRVFADAFVVGRKKDG